MENVLSVTENYTDAPNFVHLWTYVRYFICSAWTCHTL